jgi:hypothetical protein
MTGERMLPYNLAGGRYLETLGGAFVCFQFWHISFLLMAATSFEAACYRACIREGLFLNRCVLSGLHSQRLCLLRREYCG